MGQGFESDLQGRDMAEHDSFVDLIRAVRAGDSRAAAELVRVYEPEIRRIVRVRLFNPRLQQLVDSMDICQSVFANFFIRAAAGQWDLDSPAQLLRLLVSMARNKLRDQERRQSAARRGRGRAQAGALENAVDPAAGPGDRVATQDLYQAVLARLSPEERLVADLRAQGQGWAAVALELQTDPEVLRKRLTRALDRVARELGLDEVEDG
jgi:RNA polymerase sigma-70 factor (ECF subfamily)